MDKQPAPAPTTTPKEPVAGGQLPDTQKAAKSSMLQQSVIQYTYGSAVSKQNYGLLEWTKDNRIRLTELNPENGEPVKQECELALNQINKVATSITYLTFYTGGKPLTVSFSETAMPWLALGGTYGLLEAHDITKQSGIDWWIQSLRDQNVKVMDLNLIGGKNSGLFIGLLVGGVAVLAIIVGIIDMVF